ncbi:uncharacterized protein LOC62_05G007552 [Vanrija pseudolonga]|uniref:Uncharacterized protein n=1 Tax=Vanrija pseudolonga TaxID=143232 RepID=A0AAF1BN47_9TREE|nr:hypothetical protein LOC62_05G007552 [Vanrija pseudolonga]
MIGAVHSHSYAVRELTSLRSVRQPSYRLEVIRSYVRAKMSRAKHPSEVAAKLESLEAEFPHYDHTFSLVRKESGLDAFEGASRGQRANTTVGPIDSMEYLLKYLRTPAAEDPEIAEAYINNYLATKRARDLSGPQLVDKLNIILKNAPLLKEQIEAIKSQFTPEELAAMKSKPEVLSTTVGAIHSREYLLSKLDSRHNSSTWANDCIRSYIMNKKKRGASVAHIDEKLTMVEQLRRQYAHEFVACRVEFGLPFSRIITDADLNGAPVTPLPAGYGNVLSEHSAAGLDAQFSGAASTSNSQTVARSAAPSAYPLPYPGYAPPTHASPPPVPPPPQRTYIAPAVTRLEDDTATQHGEALPAYTLEDAECEAAVRIGQAQARATVAVGGTASRAPDTAVPDSTADLLARLRLAEEAQAQAEAARRDLEARLAAAEAAALAKTGANPMANPTPADAAKPPLAQLLVSQYMVASDAPTNAAAQPSPASASLGTPHPQQ